MTSAPPRKLPIDPAWIALAAAALVLIAVSAWLAQSRPAPQTRTEAEPAVIARPAEPATPAPDPLAAISAQLADLSARLAASEAALAELRARPAGDPAATQAMAARLKGLEDGLAGRIAEGSVALGRRLDSVEQSVSQRGAADQAEARRLEALERAAAERTAGEASLGRRIEALDQATTQRAAQTEQALAQRLAAIEQSTAERVAPLQDALRRLGATEARTERLGTVNALRAQLDAGQPLGTALARLGATAPEPLARYATTNPPTEASLRLSFEEAVRQARTTTSAQESLTSRLNSLLTVRRGDEVIWGDSSEVQIERARRALDAGDVEGAVTALGRLPDANRAALRGWIAEAEALVAARAALRGLAAG